MRVGLAARGARRILDLDFVERDIHLRRRALDGCTIAEEYWLTDALVDDNLRRPYDLRLFTLRVDDALRIGARAIDDPAHDTTRASEARLESLAVGIELDEVVGCSARDRRPRHRGSDPEQDARIEGEGDEIIRPELHLPQSVQRRDAVRHVLLRQQRERARRRHLHLFVDLRRSHVECAAEDERKAEDIVHLIRIITATCRDDRVIAHGAHLVRQNLRNRIGKREHNGPRRHLPDHLTRYRTRDRQSNEDVSADERVGDRARLRFDLKARLVRIHVARPALVDHALAVAHEYMLTLDAEPDVMLCRGDRRGARAGEHDDHVLDRFPGDLQRVEQRRARNDGRSMLVIVKHRNPHGFAQCFLDIETIRSANVLEIDATDCRLEQLAELHDVVGIFRSDLDVEHIDVGELLEEIALAFHHRLAGQRADVSQPEDRRAVGDDSDKVALRRVGVREIRVAFDLEARLGDAGRVCQRKVPLIGQRLRRHDGDLAGSAARMIVESVLFLCHRGRQEQ